jgi:hypothetical protein
MGVMRFTVHPAGLLDDHIQRAYVSGFDGRVFPSRVESKGETIEFLRMNSDSGKLAVPYPVEGFGRPVVSTATLREHEDNYILALELARGKICQVRNQLATWEGLGMSIPQEFRKVHREAHTLFAKATACKLDVEKATTLANKAISKSCEAAETLTNAYVQQRLSVRLKKSQQMAVSFGCSLNDIDSANKNSESFCQAFNSAAIPIEWKSIEPQEGEYDWDASDALVEYCQANKLLMRAGPLLDLSEEGLPAWLKQWGHDFFNLQSFLCDFVETAISKYQGKVRIWEVSSRINTGGAFNLNEEERLILVARTLEVARKVDEEAQLFIRIDQPWGAYQSEGNHRLSPIQFVDALLRCGIGLSGVNLEISVGYEGRDCGPRDLLDFSRLIDQWSMLEIPLHVTLAFPSSSERGEACQSDLTVESQTWRQPWSNEAQAAWINSNVPLLMAKQSVVGIYWTHLADGGQHVFPSAGLIDDAGAPKAGMEAFLKHRTGKSLH